MTSASWPEVAPPPSPGPPREYSYTSPPLVPRRMRLVDPSVPLALSHPTAVTYVPEVRPRCAVGYERAAAAAAAAAAPPLLPAPPVGTGGTGRAEAGGPGVAPAPGR
jgi:hypothetical protein